MSRHNYHSITSEHTLYAKSECNTADSLVQGLGRAYQGAWDKFWPDPFQPPPMAQ